MRIWFEQHKCVAQVTSVVINSHMVGEVAEKGFERAVGATVGGLLAWAGTSSFYFVTSKSDFSFSATPIVQEAEWYTMLPTIATGTFLYVFTLQFLEVST